jgi:hypothetical protein
MMMLGGDKKKLASIIVSKMQPQVETSEAGKAVSDFQPAKEAAAKKLIDCIKAGDAKGCAAALQDFFYLAEESEPEETETLSEEA